jgi:hypothetical protein
MSAQSQPGSAALRQALDAIAPAIENLARHQEQCDMDGVMVKVSRQALDEVLNAVNNIAIDLSGGEAVSPPMPLQAIHDAVNALGGRSDQGNSYDQGIVDTVAKVLEIIEKAQAAALPSEAIGREWQDISTAPKDGTPVLVWFRGRQHVAEYAPIWHEDNKHWCVRDPATGQEDKSNIVHEIDPPSIDGKPIPGTFSGPTHWMPLPAGPVVSRPHHQSVEKNETNNEYVSDDGQFGAGA